MDDLARYGPFALAIVAASILIAKYPLGLPRDRVRSTLVTFYGAFVLFVALDLVSSRAVTSMTDLPKAALVLLGAVLVLAIANLISLLVQNRRAPR
ncbi:MAG: hypothetical protein M3T56_13390 [Chloroflexota bacterium]|nr:hypothetical protein [Chloroflexota bacterium]